MAKTPNRPWLITLVIFCILTAVGLGASVLVARAWSAAAPGSLQGSAAAGRLTAAQASALAAEAEEALERCDWGKAVESLTALGAAGVRDSAWESRLYEARIGLGWRLLAERRNEEAEAQLALALAMRPGGVEALEGLRMAREPAAPAPASPPAVVVVQVAAPCAAQCRIIVQPGDTLFALARRFGTTVVAIQTANNLPSTMIRAGQALLIPAGCVPVCPTVCPTMCPPACVPVCPTCPPTCVPVCPTVCPTMCPPTCVPASPTPRPTVCPTVCPPVCTPTCVPVCPTPCPTVCQPACMSSSPVRAQACPTPLPALQVAVCPPVYLLPPPPCLPPCGL